MLDVRNVTKEYPTPRGALTVLAGATFSLAPGDSAAIMGPSGSGKSTLLYILGALETPTSGSVTLGGENPFALDERALAAFRNTHVGFIFQDHCLLPQCSVLENVLVPSLVHPRHAADGEQFSSRANELLEAVGLSDRLDHLPGELSGGEKQRVAIARALICEPQLILCDEPTGNLDRATAESVTAVLLDLHQRKKTMLVVVTHNPELAGRFPSRYDLVDRKLVRQM
ncbi:MAG TPA: ABC transporter ATP-binding protein [Candidatus Acidoferrales bacterium]